MTTNKAILASAVTILLGGTVAAVVLLGSESSTSPEKQLTNNISAQSTAPVAPATTQQQVQCAQDAKRSFDQYLKSDGLQYSYTYHFSPKHNQCFMEEVERGTFLGKLLYARELSNVSEGGQVYADYGESDGKQNSCKTLNVTCSSEDEYAAFVAGYMGD